MREMDGKCVCDVCGLKAPTTKYPCEQFQHECKDGLGDRIERWLSSWGITQEGYKAVKQQFGMPPDCDCDGRKEWFNRVGAHLGISADKYGEKK